MNEVDLFNSISDYVDEESMDQETPKWKLNAALRACFQVPSNNEINVRFLESLAYFIMPEVELSDALKDKIVSTRFGVCFATLKQGWISADFEKWIYVYKNGLVKVGDRPSGYF